VIVAFVILAGLVLAAPLLFSSHESLVRCPDKKLSLMVWMDDRTLANARSGAARFP
jgi:hypothetical protein